MRTDIKREIYSRTRRKLPPTLRSTENFYFLSFAVSAIASLLCVIPILAYIGPSFLAWSSALCGLLILTSLGVWRHFQSLQWAQAIFQASLIGTVLFNAYYSGGVSSPVMVWLGIVPLLPLFCTSRKWSFIWLGISFSLVILMYIAQIYGLVPSLPDQTRQQLSLSTAMTGLLCITQIILVITFETANAQTIRNISRKNATLKALSDELRTANQHKDSFLATVSHEMRTPLNAVIGFLNLLSTNDQIPTVASSHIQHAQNSASHLLTVINDLLDYSQIQQGKLILTPQTINLHSYLRETHQTLALQAAKQGLHYTLETSPHLPQWVRIDPHRVAQIILNLLANAIKFTPQGDVTTRVHSQTSSNGNTATLTLQVIDTGIGIPEELTQKIFAPFVQLAKHPHIQEDNALHGNGLGLAITLNLVQRLGGTIRVQSQCGKGSLFEIQLPIELAAAPPTPVPVTQQPANPELAAPLKLLLVDDHAINRLVAIATLRADLPDALIDEARNGTEAIELMKTQLYDLVLMDLIMPDHSGIDVVRTIRQQCPPPLCNVPVVALTANVAQNVTQECEEVGILEIIPKPFERQSLISAIQRHTQHD